MKISAFLFVVTLFSHLTFHICAGEKSTTNMTRRSEDLFHVYVVCHNEKVLLPHMVSHYRKRLPNCKITIYDNNSTDGSRMIAESLGCDVIIFNSNNESNETAKVEIKNNCWKKSTADWVVVCDIDEWLCVTKSQLDEEKKLGTTILTTHGSEISGNSSLVDLSDVNLHTLNQATDDLGESKKLCFRPNKLTEINYGAGAHYCNPVGKVQYSNKTYMNKHMNNLGIPFLVHKHKTRFERTHSNRKMNMSTHYRTNESQVVTKYNVVSQNSKIVNPERI